MKTPERALSDFMDAWSAGRRPSVEDYLEQVLEPDQAELAASIATFLEFAAAPAYDEATFEEIRREPDVAAAVQAWESEGGAWATLLPRLRQRARMTVDDLASALVAAFDLKGREAKTARYLNELESGALDPSRVSQRLLDALGRILGVGGDELQSAAIEPGARFIQPATLYRAPTPPAAPPPDLEIVADALMESGEPWDEVDELFRGGR